MFLSAIKVAVALREERQEGQDSFSDKKQLEIEDDKDER